MSRPRILLAVTVYNGRSFVPLALRSALQIEQEDAEIDVLILDDASPEPGFSEDLARMCRELGAGYYRSPRNLGIVRNVNLGLLRALDGGYDHVIISNSDVIYPANLASSLLGVVSADATIGSVTAWSNNVSVYSLPNEDPDRYLDQDAVNWVSMAMQRQFGAAAVDVPAGISFCILVPAEVIRQVGFMDPIFGRGYCEETDWSLRSLARGYRVVLAPSAFVYHAGRGSTLAAGMVAGGHTSDPHNERIIDLRHPRFRDDVRDFLSSGTLETIRATATSRILADAARQFRYTVHLGWVDRMASDTDMVRCMVSAGPDGPVVEARYRGFRARIAVDPFAPAAGIQRALGEDVLGDDIFDRRLGGAVMAPVREGFASTGSYPERI